MSSSAFWSRSSGSGLKTAFKNIAFTKLLRGGVCCLLSTLIPAQMALAGDSASAMVYSNGQAWLNGSEVPRSSALFSGDTLQTRTDSSASIQAKGSSVLVLADSLVKYDGPTSEIGVEVEEGGVRVTTSNGMAARAGDLTIKPASNSAWTEFLVADLDGQVQVSANKGDVTVQDAQGGSTTVSQGQQTTQDETRDPVKKKKKRRKAVAATAATGGIMNSTGAVWAGLGIAGGVGIWVWTRSGGPASPDCPSNSCN